MKDGQLVGSLFGEKKGIWYKIKKFLGMKTNEGIPIRVSTKINKDSVRIYY